MQQIVKQVGKTAVGALALALWGGGATVCSAQTLPGTPNAIMVATIKDGSKADVVAKPTDTGSGEAKLPLGIPTGTRFGLDYYFGYSNVTGRTVASTDGIWAGNMPFNGSSAQFSWYRGESELFFFAWGIGGMFNSKNPMFQQPGAAFYKRKIGNGFVTAGRFLTPFGQQGWMAEPRYGLMYEGGRGATSFATALQYSPANRQPNLYTRVGHQVSQRTTLGFSASLGNGVNYGTPAAYGLAFDVNHDFGKGFSLAGEYNSFMSANGPFQYASMTLNLPRFGKFQPYIGAYYWHDSLPIFGNFSRLLAGVNYQLTPSLSVACSGCKRIPNSDGSLGH
jgi:hypothetical protein